MRWLKFHYLRLSRRWRNLNRIAAAKRAARIALGVALRAEQARRTAEAAAQSSNEQLRVCRGLLATTMTERDELTAERDRLAAELADTLTTIESALAELDAIRTKSANERASSRLWLTRSQQVRVNLN